MTAADAWITVKWTEARQVFDGMDVDDHVPPADGVSPHDYFADTRRAGELEFASSFLAHALPRFEAVAWAARVLEGGVAQSAAVQLPTAQPSATLAFADRQALDHALRWLGEPTEEHRLATGEAAETAGRHSAERLLATAVFMSGGTIGPPDLEPVHPAPNLCGRLAGAAVAVAAYRSGDPAAAFARALEIGDRVAAGGADALSR